ncbi:hypothetical protein BB560_000619 [Smittium megazygosporum]|uniref:Uncharacterized protein n=1 Tax=Smittium megazygosporum TaxID=133381 RepID=A0A2T9ZJX1_9FUNG|nr:hypothetical protein BB560_000619 [Smittium megazygosporum]
MELFSDFSSVIKQTIDSRPDPNKVTLTPVSSPFFKPFKFQKIDQIRSNFIRNEFLNSSIPDKRVVEPEHRESSSSVVPKSCKSTEQSQIYRDNYELASQRTRNDIKQEVSPSAKQPKRRSGFLTSDFLPEKRVRNKKESNDTAIKGSPSFSTQNIRAAEIRNNSNSSSGYSPKAFSAKATQHINPVHNKNFAEIYASSENEFVPLMNKTGDYSPKKETLASSSKGSDTEDVVQNKVPSTTATQTEAFKEPDIKKESIKTEVSVKQKSRDEFISRKIAQTQNKEKVTNIISDDHNLAVMNECKIKSNIEEVVKVLRSQCFILGSQVFSEVERIKYVIQSKDEQVLLLSSQIEVLRERNKSLNMSKIKSLEKTKELSSEINRLETSIEDAYSLLEQFKKDLKVEKANVLKITKENEELQKKIMQQDKEAKDVIQASSEKYIKDAEDLKKQISDLEKTIEHQTADLKASESRISDLTLEINDLKSENLDLNNKLKDKENELCDALNKIKVQEEGNTMLQNEIKSLKNELEDEENKRDSLSGELLAKNNNIKELSAKNHETEKVLSETEERVGALRESVSKLEDFNSELQVNLYDLNKELKDINEETRTKETNYANEVSSLLSANSALEKENIVKITTIKDLQESNKNLMNQILEYKDKVKMLELRLESTKINQELARDNQNLLSGNSNHNVDEKKGNVSFIPNNCKTEKNQNDYPLLGNNKNDISELLVLNPPLKKDLPARSVPAGLDNLDGASNSEHALKVWVDDLLDLYASSQLGNGDFPNSPDSIEVNLLDLEIPNRSENMKVYSRKVSNLGLNRI